LSKHLGIVFLNIFIKGKPILKPATPATGDKDPQAERLVLLLGNQGFRLVRCRIGKGYRCFT